MDINISGSNINVGNSLAEYAKKSLDKKVKKYFENAINADVRFSKQRHSFHVNIIVNEGVKGGGIDIKSDANSNNIYTCFNEAAEKAAKQLRRYKRRIKR